MTDNDAPPPLSSVHDPREATDFSDFMDAFAGDLKEYLRAEKDYQLLLASKRAAQLARQATGGILMIVLLGAAVLMLSVSGALALGRLWNDPALGFLAVGGMYILLAVIGMLLWKGPVGHSFMLGIINAVYHDKD